MDSADWPLAKPVLKCGPLDELIAPVGEAMATGDVRDRSFSLKLRNLKFGMHCKILYTSIKSVSLLSPKSSSSMERHDSRIEFMRRKFLGLEKRFIFWRPSETHGGKMRWVPDYHCYCSESIKDGKV